MKKILLLSNILLVTMLLGCQDDFLDRNPKTAISAGVFFNSEEDLATYTYGLYDFPGMDLYVADASTDNAATTGATEIKAMMTGNPSPATITGGWNWEQLRSINFFLKNFRKAPIPQEALGHYEGLARFFRAKFYMEKVKRYSDVPWYGGVLEANSPELFKKRDPRTLVVDSLFADFAFAAAHVRAAQPGGAVNKWVVTAYMARHALHEGTFRKYHPELNLQGTADSYLQMARDAARQVIESGRYSIYNTGNPNQDYGSLFQSTNLAGNPEILLANYSQQDVKNSGWWAFMFGNYEASPSRDLLQAYLRADGSYYSQQAGYQEKLFVEEFEGRDPRLSQTYAYPGFDLVNTSTYSQGGGRYIQELRKNFSGYHQLKGFVNNPNPAVMNNIDIPVLRFAEVLLVYAEARAELGELTQADLDLTVNVLRQRAGMPPLTLGPPVDQQQQARYPKVAAASPQWKELLEIRRERRIELALEGFRYDDLMRWAAGDLLEKEPEGLFFPGLGNYDLTGDGVADIKLISNAESIPAEKETNSLGKALIYYRAGLPGSDASVYLKNGSSGTMVTDPERGTFVHPKYYYRPIPASQVVLNPNLQQIQGW